MYEINQSKIHLSRISGYDIKKKIYLISADHIFDSEKDLISFLAENHKPVLNFDGQPIPNTFKNEFLEDQALCGYSRKGYWDNIEDNIYCRENMEEDWKLNSYLFWLDVPGQPNLDVRNLKKDIEKEYRLQNAKKSLFQSRYDPKHRQGRKSHKYYSGRGDSRFIQRARAAYGMEAEEEYRAFVKPKDKAFRGCWPDEDFGNGGGSTGWKDNSGNRYRYQWEAKAKREFEKTKKNVSPLAESAPKFARKQKNTIVEEI